MEKWKNYYGNFATFSIILILILILFLSSAVLILKAYILTAPLLFFLAALVYQGVMRYLSRRHWRKRYLLKLKVQKEKLVGRSIKGKVVIPFEHFKDSTTSILISKTRKKSSLVKNTVLKENKDFMPILLKFKKYFQDGKENHPKKLEFGVWPKGKHKQTHLVLNFNKINNSQRQKIIEDFLNKYLRYMKGEREKNRKEKLCQLEVKER